MGKRSGIAHRDEELVALSDDELEKEIVRSKARLQIAPSAKMAKLSRQRIHWLEAERQRRLSG